MQVHRHQPWAYPPSKRCAPGPSSGKHRIYPRFVSVTTRPKGAAGSKATFVGLLPGRSKIMAISPSRPPPLPDQNRRRQRTAARRRRGPCRRAQPVHRPPPTTKVLSHGASRHPTLPSTVSGRGPLPCSSSTPAMTPSICSGDWRGVGARSSSACGRGVASTAIRASPVRPPKPDAPAATDQR